MFPPADDVNQIVIQELRRPVVCLYAPQTEPEERKHWRVTMDSTPSMGVYVGGWTGDVPIVLNGAYSTELTHEVERMAKIEVWVPPTVR